MVISDMVLMLKWLMKMKGEKKKKFKMGTQPYFICRSEQKGEAHKQPAAAGSQT